MRLFLILFSIFSTIFARPDVSQGYSYEKVGTDNFIGQAPFRTGGSGYNYDRSSTGFDQSLSTAVSSSATLGASIGINSGSSFNLNNNFDSSSNFNYAQQQQQQQVNLEPIITKNFYIHSAPEEVESQQQVRILQLGRPQKTYRVVFIKAPSPGSQSASIKAIYPKNEEKTVIYVLTKKGEDVDIGDIATPAPSAPSKPEVFFIKYKTAEEAALAQQQIKAKYDTLGGTSQISDEGVAPVTSVIGALGVSGSSNSRTISGSSASSASSSIGITPTQAGGTYLPPSK